MLDIKKNYFGHFPEFDDAVRTIGTQVIPIFEEGKRIRKVPVTVLESKEVKERHAAVRAELGLDSDLNPVQAIPKSSFTFDEFAGDPNYYKEVLGTKNLGWEDL